jgi:hypothetical protein
MRANETAAKNRAKYPGRNKMFSARWRTDNPEKAKACAAKYNANNPEKVRAAGAKRYSTPRGRARVLATAARGRARKRGLIFALDDHMEKISHTIENGCQVSGTTFNLAAGIRKPDSPSIDQIDAGKGYTFDNIRIICWCLNALFSTWGEEASIPPVLAWLRKRGYTITEPK